MMYFMKLWNIALPIISLKRLCEMNRLTNGVSLGFSKSEDTSGVSGTRVNTWVVLSRCIIIASITSPKPIFLRDSIVMGAGITANLSKKMSKAWGRNPIFSPSWARRFRNLSLFMPQNIAQSLRFSSCVAIDGRIGERLMICSLGSFFLRWSNMRSLFLKAAWRSSPLAVRRALPRKSPHVSRKLASVVRNAHGTILMARISPLNFKEEACHAQTIMRTSQPPRRSPL